MGFFYLSKVCRGRKKVGKPCPNLMRHVMSKIIIPNFWPVEYAHLFKSLWKQTMVPPTLGENILYIPQRKARVHRATFVFIPISLLTPPMAKETRKLSSQQEHNKMYGWMHEQHKKTRRYFTRSTKEATIGMNSGGAVNMEGGARHDGSLGREWPGPA